MEVGKRSPSAEPGFYNIPKLRRALIAGLQMAKKLRGTQDEE